MGYTTSTVHGIDVPDSAEANNVPEDLQKIVDVLETGSLIKRLSGSTISGLTNAQKPAGLVVYNTTTNKLQISNGSTFANIDASLLPLAGGTMTGNIAMGGSNKVTGLAAATTNGDAVRYNEFNATKTTVDGLGTWQAWTPTLAVGSGTVTASATANECRYTQIGKTVHGIGHMNVTAATGSAAIRIPLPVTPTSTSAIARRVGSVQFFADGKVGQYFLEQAQNQTYCAAVAGFDIGATAIFLTATDVASFVSQYGAGDTFLAWNFTYEAA